MKHKETATVYQFKIVLNGIKPLIWRRIQVEDSFSFWDLHVAIQDSMGWQDYHLHRFEVTNPMTGVRTKIGIPNEQSKWKRELLPGWKQGIRHYFTATYNKAQYLYDYLGDNWNHTVTLEGMFPGEETTRYPICLDGRRACPPEDCGGVQGYHRLLRSIHENNHKQTMELTGGTYDPEGFDIEKIHFDNSEDRLDFAFNK